MVTHLLIIRELKSLKVNYALKIARSFGVFQAIMPGIGWLAGFSLRDII
ncbi:hypothetical protein CW714_04860 [Methanophagales archaeon]|nr:MAG: hypothetical protein CW714_04860 [Methanophagales archaeon]